MLLAITDVETTGLDPQKHQVIEVAAVLYDTDHRVIVQQVSTVLPCQTNEAQHINGIEPALSLPLDAHLMGSALELIDAMLLTARYAVAYNAPFDKQWFKDPLPTVADLMWVDAMLMPWQHHKSQPSLIDLCIAHHVPVVRAHRALDDCVLLAELIGKLDDIKGAIAYARQPRVTLQAITRYEQKDLARDAGFRWDAAGKCWFKPNVPKSEVESVRGALPFDCVVVEGN